VPFGYTSGVRPVGVEDRAILDFVRQHFAAALGTTRLDADTPLFSSGLVDSFGVLELIAFIEETFQVRIELSAHPIEDFDTVDTIVRLIQRLPQT